MREKNQHNQQNRGEYPQESYAVVLREIQSEWIFLQCVTWDTGDAFVGVEKMIQDNFLPHLFFGNTKTLSPIVGALSTMLVMKYGMGLLNPVTSAQEKYLTYQRGSAELIWAVTGGGEFSNANHLRTLGEERRDGDKDQEYAYKNKLKSLVRNLKVTGRSLILRAKITAD